MTLTEGATSALWAAMDDTAETVLLVDAADRAVGEAGKLEAHEKGLRHRAVSVMVADGAGRLMLQRRAAIKYHSGGLWTNTCCSHPRIGEPIAEAAVRRLREEMGIDCALRPLFVFSYAEQVGGLFENEVVHVFGGRHDGPAAPNPGEADAFAFMTLPEIEARIAERPETFTVWFRHYVARRRDEIAAFLDASRYV